MNVLKGLIHAVIMLPAWILMDLSPAPATQASLEMGSTAQVSFINNGLLSIFQSG